MSTNNAQELFAITITLADCVKRMFKTTGRTNLSSDPLVEKKAIVEFMRRMRVFGMEKFESAAYIASVNYYASKRDMEKNHALGALVIYIEEDYIERLLRILQYPRLEDNEDESILKDACGTICNVIGGQFKAALSQMGYVELEMSAFSSFRNSAPLGIEFDAGQTDKYEISFSIEGVKRLVVELTMGPVPKT